MWVLLLSGASALADPAVVGLDLVFRSGVQVAAEKDGAYVYDVQSGGSAPFSVIATFADGSTLDVTADPELQQTILLPRATLPQPGELSFGQVFHRASVGLATEYRGRTVFTSFIIHP